MSFSGWLIAGTVFIIIIIIALGLGWWFRNRNNTPPASATQSNYTSPQIWSKPFPSSNNLKNTCQVYDFPVGEFKDGLSTYILPGNPTLNSDILNSKIGSSKLPNCLDSNQIIAQQVTHTCIAPNGVIQGSITKCNLLTGGVTGVGGSEVFYTSSTCPNILQCPGEISLVSINYQVPNNSPLCIEYVPSSSFPVLMNDCDPSVLNQNFRITRIDIGQNPNSLQPGDGQNGILAQILDPNTGLCLTPNFSSQIPLVYSPTYLNNPNCSGQVQLLLNNPSLSFSKCSEGPYPGYVWLFLPYINFCPDTSDPTSCYVSYPQIVYIGNLDYNKIPKGDIYKGQTGNSAILQWLIDNNALSIYYGGLVNPTNPQGVGLLPINKYPTDLCFNSSYSSQYINISLYNTIINQSVCNGTNTSQCISL